MLSESDPEPTQYRRPKPAPKPTVVQSSGSTQSQGSMVQSFLNNKAFQDTVRAMVLEALRTPEGQDLLAQIVRKELNKQK